MKGIVQISHGDVAKGMAQASTMFFGDPIDQLTYCGLQPDDGPDEFGKRIGEAIAKVDTGEGVLVLTDLFGGTPSNQAIQHLGDGVDLIAGMNFPLLLELLGARLAGEVDVDTLLERGRSGIVDIKAALAKMMDEDDD